MISNAKDKILQGAARLFFTEGLSTGIDRVISECCVAKMTVYKLFKSKGGLICVILGDVQRSLQEEIRRETTRDARIAREQLEAACLVLCAGMTDPDLKVGLSVRALIEFPNPKNTVHQAARQFDLTILKWFEQLGESALLPDARKAARQILHVAKGCFLMAPSVKLEINAVLALALLRPVLAQSHGEIITPRQTGTRHSDGHSPSLPTSRV